MIKTKAITLIPKVQCRYASVLASSSSLAPIGSSYSSLQHDSRYIVTPASASCTTPSNNYFHPAHIPKKTQIRLTLDELKEVLESSRQLLQHLQQEYVNKSSLQTPMDLKQVIEQQIKLVESLSSQYNKKNKTGGDRE